MTTGSKSRLLSMTILAAGVVALYGIAAPRPAAAAAKQPIAVSVADQKSLFYIAAVDGMRDEAKQDGYELRVASASNNSRQQINQIQNLLVQQPEIGRAHV